MNLSNLKLDLKPGEYITLSEKPHLRSYVTLTRDDRPMLVNIIRPSLQPKVNNVDN